MKRQIAFTALWLSFFGCSLRNRNPVTDTFYGVSPKSAVDAGRHELVFRYPCGDRLDYAFEGTGGCQYQEGAFGYVEVSVPNTKGQVVMRSARREYVDDFQSKGWVRVPIEYHKSSDGGPVFLIVSGASSGIQTGKFYPYIYDAVHPPMVGKTKFFCYSKGYAVDAIGQSFCQQPAGTKVVGLLEIKPGLGGRYLVTADGCDLKKPAVSTGTFTKESVPKFYEVAKAVPGACFVRINIAYSDGTIFEHEASLDFWSPAYIPLTKPRISIGNVETTICAPQGWKHLTVNRGSFDMNVWSDRCFYIEQPDESPIYAISWDADGRVSQENITQEIFEEKPDRNPKDISGGVEAN